mmetsp:Transcript_48179/g.139602  ORF Transcript_48179/g.139602 Transcript_48179/m.139602 type:complete len:432 (+) Transcript_48179:138-1433(+)
MDSFTWCIPIALLAMLMTLLTWILISPPAVPCLAASPCFPHFLPSLPSSQPSSLPSWLNGGVEQTLDVELLPFPADAAGSSQVCPWRTCLRSQRRCGACREERPEADTVPVVPDGWMPDIRKLRRFAIARADAQGRHFPPELPKELCGHIPFGIRHADSTVTLLKEAQIKAQTAESAGPSIMCIIYTMEKHHYSQLRAMRETWASGCDGWLAFSNVSDPRIPTISIPHAGKEEYKNMWQKVRSMWHFVAKHYSEEFGFFVMGGDDMFIMPQNLRNYLALVGAAPGKQHFLGRRLKTGHGDRGTLFNSGGAGYVLSRRTLRTLDEHLNDSRCGPERRTSTEDVNVAECLWKVAGVLPEDTRDELGRERFHPFPPATHWSLKSDADGWYGQYNRDWGLKYGKDCCAPDSVSFHYMRPPSHMRLLYALLYTCGG